MPHVRRDQGLPVVRRAVALGVAGSLLVASLAACGQSPPASANLPAALAVGKLLELRRARSTDFKVYALFFKSDAIPRSLAQDAAQPATSTRPPIPEWDAPYVSTLTSKTAEVVVPWKADGRFPGHAAVTVFTLERFQQRWVIVDAVDLKDAGRAPPPLKP